VPAIADIGCGVIPAITGTKHTRLNTTTKNVLLAPVEETLQLTFSFFFPFHGCAAFFLPFFHRGCNAGGAPSTPPCAALARASSSSTVPTSISSSQLV
jgi:hypothetical protein